MSETLYIQINRNIQVDKREITIGDVAALLCKNAGITARVKTIKLITLPDVPKRRVSFSVITVMEKIEKIYPDLQLVSIGESDFIVDYIRQKKKSRVWQGLMVAFVSVFKVIEIAYAVGLLLGIVVFYNHFAGKHFTGDPTPIQVAMRKYEQDVDTTYIETSSRKGKSKKV